MGNEEASSPVEKSENSSNLDWLKDKLKTLWSSSKFCGLCLERNGNFCSVDMEFMISKQTVSKCLQDIINYVFNDDIENLMSSLYVCDRCVENVINSYLFISNTKQLSKLIINCISDIYSKATDVNEQLDDATDYENSNVMIVLESDEDLYKSIIDMRSLTEIIPTPLPVVLNKQPPEKPKAVEIQKPVIPKEKDPVKQIKIKNVVSEKMIVKPNITLKGGQLTIKPLDSTSKSTIVPKYNVYECPNCPDIFTTYRSLKEHEKAKHKSTVFRCHLCDKVYNTQQYLNIHYKTHSKVRCKLCQTILPEDELLNHLRSCHASLVYPCKFCDLVYYTQESLDTHFKISHLVNDTKTKSQCIMCLRNFMEEELKTHKCKFACSECFVMPCVHYKFLMSYREQILNHSNNVQCVFCDYTTKRKEHLIGHANREHLDHHPFTCADCGQQFYTKLSLKTHIFQFHQDHSCPYCDSELKDKNAADTHIKTCKSVVRSFRCQHCVASFETEDELVKHDNLKHNDNVFACTLCKSKFLTELALQEHHARIHGGIQCKKRRKHIECSLCNIMFKNIKEMTQHEQLHDPEDIYPCKVCSKQFKTLTKLYIHNQRHYTNRIKCNGCNKKVAASFYAQHAVRCPYSKKTALDHVCEVCGKSFHLESLLRLHLKIHMDPEPCPHCDKVIKPSSLKRHMEQFHDIESSEKTKKITAQNKPSIECELCGHVVRKKCDLEAHMNRYHLKIKPYVCHICSKDFCGKVRLKEHIATHTSDNSCFCSICNKKFANRVCLKMHFRMHTGESPYTCDICNQKFRSSSMMKTHRLKKHLEKSVSCPICDSMFYLVRDMRHHFKKIHWKLKDQPFDPRLVSALSPKYYHLFEDGRLPKLDE